MIRRKNTPSEATRARERAEQELDQMRSETEQTRAQTPAFRDLGERLARARERNHFSESIAALYRGGPS